MLFFFSFLPQFITDPESHYVSRMIIMSATFMGLTLLIFSLYALLVHYLKSLFLHSPRISRRIQRCIGGVLIASAVRLAFTEE
ncbi:hypothetical protein STHERM_c12180 [Spirochaeta thermophila DSM 6192]|uniref:Lysine exporter protein (LYSE/YGGA) n=2 Tax=Winmispira thermophila TaxID=154 RepID=E0RT22_WINT6|nr:hypothetical protein STHERM_c12180 [Spirochaeta thermophila DSM 6192]